MKKLIILCLLSISAFSQASECPNREIIDSDFFENNKVSLKFTKDFEPPVAALKFGDKSNWWKNYWGNSVNATYTFGRGSKTIPAGTIIAVKSAHTADGDTDGGPFSAALTWMIPADNEYQLQSISLHHQPLSDLRVKRVRKYFGIQFMCEEK